MKIYIQKPFTSSGDFKYSIYLIDDEDSQTHRAQITYDSATELLTRTVLNPNEHVQVKPFLVIPEFIFNDFAKAILNYASDNNIKTENENLLVGKMDATEKHLEDMRKIVFKDLEKQQS